MANRLPIDAPIVEDAPQGVSPTEPARSELGSADVESSPPLDDEDPLLSASDFSVTASDGVTATEIEPLAPPFSDPSEASIEPIPVASSQSLPGPSSDAPFVAPAETSPDPVPEASTEAATEGVREAAAEAPSGDEVAAEAEPQGAEREDGGEPETAFLEEQPLPPTDPAPATGFRSGERIDTDAGPVEITGALAGSWFAATHEGSEFLVSAKVGAWTEDLKHPALPTPVHVRDGLVVLRRAVGPQVKPPLAPSEAFGVALALTRLVRFFEAKRFAIVDLDPDGLVFDGASLKSRLVPRIVPLGERLPALARDGFSPPEAQRGDALASGREGVYLVGSTLYYLLTGERLAPDAVGPLTWQTFDAAGLPQLFARALQTNPSGRATPEELFGRLTQLLAAVENPHGVAAHPDFDVQVATSIGLDPGRPVNEDAAGYARFLLADVHGAKTALVACVADGIGGEAAGERASAAAVRAFCALPVDAQVGKVDQQRAATIELAWRANDAVVKALLASNGGCTLTGVVIVDERVTLAHAGDSRAYLRAQSGGLRVLTSDHTLAATKVASGEMTEEQARVDPEKSVITRSLGSVRQVTPRYFDELTESLDLGEDEMLILCTDGVWGAVTEDAFREVVTHTRTAVDVVRGLVAAANAAGGQDNATALVIHRRPRHPAGT